MKYLTYYCIVIMLALLFAWIFSRMEQRLIEAVPLNEVTVTLEKRQELSRHDLFCRHKFPNITETGKWLLCRKGI
jgi:hypothetical protein